MSCDSRFAAGAGAGAGVATGARRRSGHRRRRGGHRRRGSGRRRRGSRRRRRRRRQDGGSRRARRVRALVRLGRRREQRLRVRIAVAGVQSHPAGEDVVERGRHPGGALAEARRLLVDLRVQQRGIGLVVVRHLAGQALEQHRGERVLVAARRRALALDLLGRDVCERADELARARRPAGAAAREAEIREVGPVGLVDEDVLRLDVAMDEPRCVRGVECRRDRCEQAQRAGGVELARVDEVLQRVAAHVAHREIQAVLGLAGVVDRDDVRVVERRLDLALAAEARAERLVGGQRRVEQLQRDRAVQGLLRREVHGAHAAAAEQALDAVAGEPRPGLDHQRLPMIVRVDGDGRRWRRWRWWRRRLTVASGVAGGGGRRRRWWAASCAFATLSAGTLIAADGRGRQRARAAAPDGASRALSESPPPPLTSRPAARPTAKAIEHASAANFTTRPSSGPRRAGHPLGAAADGQARVPSRAPRACAFLTAVILRILMPSRSWDGHGDLRRRRGRRTPFSPRIPCMPARAP